MSLHHILKDLQRRVDPKKAKSYQKFFKKEYTNKKDRFLGISLPDIRAVAKRHKGATLKDIQKLLKSDIHEYRMLGGVLLTNKFRDEEFQRKIIYAFYLKNLNAFNNWDLVDVTADKIIGKYLLKNKEERKTLYDLANSENLWDRRISMVATLEFIRNKDFDDTLKIAKINLKDNHDLMHKAVGWMLRELGKRDKDLLLKFLKENYREISRTTLRYAIERFPEEKRKEILRGKFL